MATKRINFKHTLATSATTGDKIIVPVSWDNHLQLVADGPNAEVMIKQLSTDITVPAYFDVTQVYVRSLLDQRRGGLILQDVLETPRKVSDVAKDWVSARTLENVISTGGETFMAFHGLEFYFIVGTGWSAESGTDEIVWNLKIENSPIFNESPFGSKLNERPARIIMDSDSLAPMAFENARRQRGQFQNSLGTREGLATAGFGNPIPPGGFL